MGNQTITISIDPQTAAAYNSAAPEEKRQMQALLALWLRQLSVGPQRPLQQVLDEAGRKAASQGLTEDVLESLLKGT